VDTDTTRLDAGHAPPATAEILEGLNDLLQLDHDAVGAYQIAMEKLHDRDHADQIAGFRRDHERHIRELNELIADLGGTPKNHPHATGPFKLALQSLGGLAGDKGVLMAFRTNELQVRSKYDSYAQQVRLVRLQGQPLAHQHQARDRRLRAGRGAALPLGERRAGQGRERHARPHRQGA
jgi:hypothetical protein